MQLLQYDLQGYTLPGRIALLKDLQFLKNRGKTNSSFNTPSICKPIHPQAIPPRASSSPGCSHSGSLSMCLHHHKASDQAATDSPCNPNARKFSNPILNLPPSTTLSDLFFFSSEKHNKGFSLFALHSLSLGTYTASFPGAPE